jgi:hypothetical protein
MKNCLIRLLSACCLFLAVLIAGCGIISLRDHRALIHRRFDSNNDMRVNAIASCDGALWLFNSVHLRRPGTIFTDAGWYFGPASFGGDRPWLRPYYQKHSNSGGLHYMLVLPHWFVALVFLSFGLPYLLLMRNQMRSRRRLRRGQCPRCGFDLRATPDRCPECGWIKAWGIVPTDKSISIPR